MPIIFSDEDLMYLDKERDDKLHSIRQEIDTMKAKGNASFCKKCGHVMQYFTVGNAKMLLCGFCGNRIAEMIKSDEGKI
ncbi:MAG TPA: hypothetical protein VER35_03020 [Candidatus Limnocylindrales bacterium]|nr:hypothetical protein [Candidatus Limnocylindrales bacterium]